MLRNLITAYKISKDRSQKSHRTLMWVYSVHVREKEMEAYGVSTTPEGVDLSSRSKTWAPGVLTPEAMFIPLHCEEFRDQAMEALWFGYWVSPRGYVLKPCFPGWCYWEVAEPLIGGAYWKVFRSLGAWPWCETLIASSFSFLHLVMRWVGLLHHVHLLWWSTPSLVHKQLGQLVVDWTF
jgi:hypothetical protein